MTRQRLAWTLLGVWLAVYVWSVLVMQTTPAEGDGFTRGMNRITSFLAWQGVAAVLGLLIWRLGQSFAPATAGRWLSRVPTLLAGLLVVAILGLIAFAGFDHY